MKVYTIACICQVFNEIERGNFERFLSHIKPIVDHLVIYDDCSSDGTYECALQATAHVLRGRRNDFAGEVSHRQAMLAAAIELKPDFILWLDADEVLTVGAEVTLQAACQRCIDEDLDGVELLEINLWRSGSWRRLDSLYGDAWFARLWRVRPGLAFAEEKRGLHQRLVPEAIQRTFRASNPAVLHYGFASELNLAYKYLIYRSHGQRGYEMLDRILDESQLVLERVPDQLIPVDLRDDGVQPIPVDFTYALAGAEALRERVFRPKYSIICLIYKSIDWLQFSYDQIIRYTQRDDVEFFFVANDANDAVISYLRDNYIPHKIFENTPENKREWYINNVYRAYNYGAKLARGDFIVFLNSDMGLSPGWLDALIGAYSGDNLVAARLVESGKLPTGRHGLERNFGRTIANYREEDFTEFAKAIREDHLLDGGLYMPLLVRRDKFLQVGGYPEGNIVEGSEIFSPVIAKRGDPMISGDAVFMQRMASIGIKHQTCYNSVVYHFQEGEKDDLETSVYRERRSDIAIVNDICGGINGERVLWNFLLENLPCAYRVDKQTVGNSGFETRAKRFIDHEHPGTKIIIQNASFIGTIDADRHTIAFLQDDLRQMGRHNRQQEANLLLAKTLVTNSAQTAASYPEFDFEIIPVGIDATLFSPGDQSAERTVFNLGASKIGIFVGSLTETKGWSRVKQCIKQYPEIQWIVVTKYDEDFTASNVHVFRRIDQTTLARLYRCADFFIIGSPVETQCLAALEANLCGLPVVMPLVGIYRDFSENERAAVGVFGEDLVSGVAQVLAGKFSPRDVILARGLTVADSMRRWVTLIEGIAAKLRFEELENSVTNKGWMRRAGAVIYRAEAIFRRKVILPIFGQQYLNLHFWLSIPGLRRIARLILIRFGLFDTVKSWFRK